MIVFFPPKPRIGAFVYRNAGKVHTILRIDQLRENRSLIIAGKLNLRRLPPLKQCWIQLEDVSGKV